MKQFLHASSLVLVAALAVLALPAGADTLELSYDDGFPCLMEADTTDVFTAIRGSTNATKTVRAQSDNTAVVDLVSRSKSFARGQDTVEFSLRAKKSGTARITVQITGDTEAVASFPVTVTTPGEDGIIRFKDAAGNILSSRTVSFGEGESQVVQVQPAREFTVTSTAADTADHLVYNPMAGVVTLRGLDGTWTTSLVFTDPSGECDPSSLTVIVTNKPPRVNGNPDINTPTVLGKSILKNKLVEFKASEFTPTDPAPADQTKLKLTWSLSGGQIGPDGAFTNKWTSPTESGNYEIFSVTVTDGDSSFTGYYAVEVKDTVTLYTDTASPWAGLARQGGVAQATTFRVFDGTGQEVEWELVDGTIYRSLLYPGENATVRAVLEPGSYPFGWYGDTEAVLLVDNATYVPSTSLRTIATLPSEGGATIRYLASYPFYHTPGRPGAVNGENNVWDETFGDFDADSLSDVWEDYWFQTGMQDPEVVSANTTKLPVGSPAGDYGPDGNLDGDWLPTTLLETAPDGDDKAGWPVVRGDQTNRVFVFKYPLVFSTGGESYYKGDRDEKPLFGNQVEYRGLLEDRVGDGTVAGDLVRYAPDFVDKTSRYTLDGENCAGTNPNALDTDDDGFSDGWEYYFWTTVKYGVHTENWRAWDPTYSYYSTDSARAGFPLLETDDPLEYEFDVEPTRGYDIDPVAGTYRTSYEVSEKVLKDNDVVLPVVPGSVTIEFVGSGFAVRTFSREIAKLLGVNPKDANGNDRLFYSLHVDSDGDGTPDAVVVNPESGLPEFRALEGAWVNDLSGEMSLPGWQKLVLLENALSFDVAQDTLIHVSLKRQNGLFPKQFLLSRFDPMNWDQYLAGDIPSRVAAAGFMPKYWDPTADLDGDGVLDVEEYFLGTDPLHWDTDRDGMPDGWEVQRGLLPTDPRNKVNGCGPDDNPDEDYMAWDATGTAKHADAYRADLANEVYWNGKTFTGYVPGRGLFPPKCGFSMEYQQGNKTVMLAVSKVFGGSGYGNLEEFLYSYYGIAHGFWSQVYPSTGGDTFEWANTTTDPCNNDTDEDGIPDGWECYVGFSPIVPYTKTPEDLVEGIGYAFDPMGYLEQPPVCQGPPWDPDDATDTPDLHDEFRCLWAHQMWPSNVVKTIGPGGVVVLGSVAAGEEVTNATVVTVNALPEYPGWYNKWMPTDPWNADTDGDGLSDFQEYSDEADGNEDGNPLANFNPTQVDTDLDWLPDGWEYTMGTYAYEQLPNLDATDVTDAYGPFGDPDGDKLANYQEYLTGANYGWRYDKWYPMSNEAIWVPQTRTLDETHKWDSTNPWDWPYDPGLYPEFGPVVRVHDYTQLDFFAVPVSGTTIGRGMEALKVLEKRWNYTIADSPSMEMETLAARLQRVYEIIYNYQAARAIPVADGNPPRDDAASLFLYDTDPLWDPNYNYDQEPVLGKKYFQHHSRAEHDAIVALFEGISGWIYSYGQCGYGWDLSGSLLNGGLYMPLNGNSSGYGFPGTRPRKVDSDNDGMPDYWEIYHGLNPTYGGARLLGKAGDPPDGDRADRDAMGDGSTDNWIMGYDPAYVLNLNFAMRYPYTWPVARKAKTGWGLDADGEWNPYSFDDAVATAFGPDLLGNYIMEWGHFDLVNRPWLSGDKAADCDKDGVNNQEEAYSFFAPDIWNHTDPSPYWLTDMSQTVGAFGQNASHVNLYYRASDYGPAQMWWWAVPFEGSKTDAPQYVWDFETNEGFDTDNDNIGDREELASVSARGKTDPLSCDSPVSRKAMYFDGHAACRTQRPFFHGQYALVSHTVEFWVRPHAYPRRGRVSTFLHRPVMMPVDTLSGSGQWQIRNTFHVYMDDRGRVFAEVDNDAVEQAANSAVVMSAGRLSLDQWTHVAVVMDSQKDELSLYLNGEFAARVATSLKPCTGTIMSSAFREWMTSNGGSTNGLVTTSRTDVAFDYTPAPIVLGAYERNPWGVVGGKLWDKTESQFDENRFFDGWIDEVRIWDRCRTQTEIMNNMTKRFTAADVSAVNQARWVWDKNNLYSTDATADFPQKLLYHYTFDNVPDVVPATTRQDGTVFATDTDAVPAGWEINDPIRPVPFVPWWYVADNRTTVYATDFSYVPFVENTASHLAQRPPRDVSEIVPVYATNSWKLLGYRNRLSEDWAVENQSVIETGGREFAEMVYNEAPAYYTTNVTGTATGTSGNYVYFYEGGDLLSPTLLKNSMNPYGDGYCTHVRGTYEYNPWNFGGALDRYGVYEGVPIHSDLVPLLDAVADIDVPMWDGKGPGWDNGAIDSDGDGLPDWWETAQGLDPNDAAGVNGAYGDRDDDGLDNWAEYLAGTNPMAYDSDSDGYSDYYSRPDGRSLTYGELYDDGDGMDNAWEISCGLDPNRYDGTDDADNDGWTNWEEFMAGTDPTRADDFPEPFFNVEFFYAGERKYALDGKGYAQPYVYAYGEKTAGPTMGGRSDGLYRSNRTQGEVPWTRASLRSPDDPDVFRFTTLVDVINYDDPTSSADSIYSGVFRVLSGGLSPEVGGETQSFAWISRLGSRPVGGGAKITLFLNGQRQTVTTSTYAKDPDFELVFEDMNTGTLVLLHPSSGLVYGRGLSSEVESAEYAVAGRSFPYTVRGLNRMSTGAHDHMVSGWNRFLGFLDLNGSAAWEPGEPMGLSRPRPTLVSWDSVETQIPLSDSVWDYPRISWPSINWDEAVYYVTFTWIRGSSTGTGASEGLESKTGDRDRDGLENWMETLAGTAVASASGTTNDWYRMSGGSDGYFYGELYDDGDGMPTAWEMKYGLDPYRYDGNADQDDDGWSNYAEFMAGTDPANAGSYPRPKFSVTFDYHGRQTDLYSLGVYSYGESTQGDTWGGSFDGRYTSTKGFSYGRTLGSDGSVTLDKYSDVGASGTFAYTTLDHGLIESASINVYVPGADGATETRSFEMQQINPGMGLFTQDELGWILIEIESGRVLVTGDYVGKTANISTWVRSYSFPVTFSSLIRNPVGNQTHMVEGPNRFFGWMDVDGNGEFDTGEPSGLSIWGPTIVGWDSVTTEIPLTDELWDYPRLSWKDLAPTNFTPTFYIVSFDAEGSGNTSGSANAYGDLDGDGLDAWQEARAGTDLNKPDTDGDGRLDYDQVDSAGAVDPDAALTFGEALDDTDGMPAAWEIAYGLDPHRYDADGDLDGDGWSNYAEFMADSDPTDPDSFPEPQLDVTFRYNGEIIGTSGLKVFAYSEKRQGTDLDGNPSETIYMGGNYDGLYTTISTTVGLWGDDSLEYNALETTWGSSWSGGRRLSTATITYYDNDGQLVQAQAEPFADNPDYGVFLDDGTGRIFIEWKTGMVLTQFYEEEGDVTSVEGQSLGGGTGIIVQPARSSRYAPNYRLTYTIAGVEYPMTVPHLSRELGGMHNHMVEGYNRFLAIMDLDASGTWEPGEPMGVSLYDATLVGWNTVSVEIPLTDELFGFPRVSWPASSNDNVTAYTVYFKGAGGTSSFVVEAPRTFLHEGDFLEAGVRGLDFGSAAEDTFEWWVNANDGILPEAETVASGYVVRSFRPNTGVRRTMEPLSPVAGNVERGTTVEFEWKMDWRTEGVFFTVRNETTGQTVLDDLYVPLPVRHGKITDDDYYYSFVPQLADGRTFVSFPDGEYSYVISENLRTTSPDVPKQSVTGSFTVSSAAVSRDRAPVSGFVHYYGRLAGSDGVFPAGPVVLLAYRLSDDSTTSLDLSGNPVARVDLSGAGAFETPALEPGRYGLVAFVDADGDGLPGADETQGRAFVGGSADPVQLPEWCKPISIDIDPADDSARPVSGVHVVLRDRDRNGDGVPEAFGGTLAGYKALPVVTVPATAEPDWVSTAWFDPDFSPTTGRRTRVRGGASQTHADFQFAVKAPRMFLHEGDLARLGLYGFDLGSSEKVTFEWTVTATDGIRESSFQGESFTVWAPTRPGPAPAGTPADALVEYRKPIKARWPTDMTVVRGSVVDFEWEMDSHNAGVVFNLWQLDGPEGSPTNHLIADMVVPFPVLHWDATVENYYWVARPQAEDGRRFLRLPDGFYEYSVTERPNTTAVVPGSFTARFQMKNGEPSRTTGSIEGRLWYFGRSMDPGDPPEWPADLHVRAYLASEESATSASIGGLILAETVQRTNGTFRLEGLKAGTYSVLAFVDSNGNGMADDWETQGFAVFGGSAAAVVVPESTFPIVVTNGAAVTGLNLVLHDRDTDRDLLPDVWEWKNYESLSAHNGYEAAVSNAYVTLAWNEPDNLTNWSWPVDWSGVVRRPVVSETDAIRVRVDGPRNFLHEGDFLTPYVRKNPFAGLVAEGVAAEGDTSTGDITRYLWRQTQIGGSKEWIPLDQPYYGFYLGSYSNSVVNWTVDIWTGAESYTVTGGSFQVIAPVGEARQPLVARYPTQKTVVNGSAVEFEWKMDGHNAGVLFDLWRVGLLTTNLADGIRDVELIEPVQVVTNMVIAFPVQHGLTGNDDTYYSATPQLDDGAQLDLSAGDNSTRFWAPDQGKLPIQLEDGLYRYRITERPQTDLVDPMSVTEYFQLDNTSSGRGLYTASGTIRYYGKVMQRTVVTNLGSAAEVDATDFSFEKSVDPALFENRRGALAVLLVRAGSETNWDGTNVVSGWEWAEESFNDSAANGILYAVGGANNVAWSGSVDYESGRIYLKFDSPPAANLQILLVQKEFPNQLYLQVYKLPDEAATSTAVSGVPVQVIKRDPNVKGEFEVSNLTAGKYAIRAFVDSNGNGTADAWETQGVAVKTGRVSPNIDSGAEPIEVGGLENNVSGLMIVLHDRDTDNDLLPDSWEWWKTREVYGTGSLLVSGYDVSEAGGLHWWQEYADGVLDSDPRTPDTDLDGLTDAMEILVTGTDTHLRDTDGDGVGDLEEFLSGSDPLDPADKVRYAIPALDFDEAGAPFVDVAYPALRPGVVLTYELQRRLALEDGTWEVVASFDAACTDGTTLYGAQDGVNVRASLPGTARMKPADQAAGVDFTTGFYRVKIYADYGKMVDNGDGTWSYWAWTDGGDGVWTFREAARGAGSLVRDADGNWRFVDPETRLPAGSLVRGADGSWSFKN